MLRCSICDYTNEEGSDYADRAPSIHNHVHLTPNGDYICDECLASIDENLHDISDVDDED